MHQRRSYRRANFCVFPGYRWCGPGCRGPGAPINKTDAACKAHDECYRKTGNYCACDEVFIKRLSSLKTLQTQEGRHARLMLQYMKIQVILSCQ
ncbi:phospholipase [Saliterribacillus persicus]|uniref:phospholipase n=1 Tax=Saliterribacillus persicus TaxID=930114 RepID=UPI000DF4257E|nr:phospholipase [Saliterribacillus persicus]